MIFREKRLFDFKSFYINYKYERSRKCLKNGFI